jgi:hypothetical protein
MAKIEPVEFLWVNGEIKLGVNLRVYTLYQLLELDRRVKVEITDIDDALLFSTILTAETIYDVAKQLNLKLKTDTMDNRKELLTEIMEADDKDGLYEQQTLEEAALNYTLYQQYQENYLLKVLNGWNKECTLRKKC